MIGPIGPLYSISFLFLYLLACNEVFLCNEHVLFMRLNYCYFIDMAKKKLKLCRIFKSTESLNDEVNFKISGHYALL